MRIFMLLCALTITFSCKQRNEDAGSLKATETTVTDTEVGRKITARLDDDIGPISVSDDTYYAGGGCSVKSNDAYYLSIVRRIQDEITKQVQKTKWIFFSETRTEIVQSEQFAVDRLIVPQQGQNFDFLKTSAEKNIWVKAYKFDQSRYHKITCRATFVGPYDQYYYALTEMTLVMPDGKEEVRKFQ